MPPDDAVRNESEIPGSVASREEGQAIMRAAQDRYDGGADSQTALAL